MIDEPQIMVRKQEDLAILTLNQPARRNALTNHMFTQLSEQLRQLENDSSVRCLVLTGAQGHFSAGGDITEMTDRTTLEQRSRLSDLTVLIRRLAGGPKPIVAAVEGVCIGAGLSIASLCDYVVASADVKFCAAFMRVGLMPDLGGLWAVQQRVGRSKAREIFQLARSFDGNEGFRIGLVNEVVTTGSAFERAVEVASEYAAMPPLSMAMLRSALAQETDALDVALRVEVDYQTQLRETQDHREAVAAFTEKRKPHFVGH